MDRNSIDRIRSASFSHAVRGYDRAEVDRFLAELADWLDDRGDGDDSELVRAELDRVGELTSNILTEAHDAAERIRDEAEREVRQSLVDANLKSERLRSEAEEYAEETREQADAYARKVRGEAKKQADQLRGEAEAEAAQLREETAAEAKARRTAAAKEAERAVETATRRRREIEKVISDLEERRNAVIDELERLASGLAGTATEHRGSGREAGDPPPAAASGQASRPRATQKST